MQNLRRMINRYMCGVAIVFVVVILIVALGVQVLGAQYSAHQSAVSMLVQLEQLLEANSNELEAVKKEYADTCLKNAEAIAYIIQYHPEAVQSIEELIKIAEFMEVDEIHIFDKTGKIVMGTHPEYYGLTVDSGEQIAFFKPMLTDKTLKLCQDITPNTGAEKMMQYSALWSENGEFILQVGMEPVNVLQVTKKNELSYIFSMLQVSTGVNFYAIEAKNGEIIGSTDKNVVGQNMHEAGFELQDIEKNGEGFHTSVDGVASYCVFHKMGSYYVGRSIANDILYARIPGQMLGLVICLILIAIVLVFFVSGYMNRYVIGSIHKVNDKLRSITEGNLDESVEVSSSIEFKELSSHINAMIKSLLASTAKISYILNKTNVHVGVYEYNEKMKTVRFTEYLPQLLAMDEETTKRFSADYTLFKEYLEQVWKRRISGEEGIYRIKGNAERYVKIEEVKQNNDTFGIVIDMTEEILKRKQAEAERDTDLLTGLYNRRGVEIRLAELFEDPEELGYGAMIMLDADGLKQINDRYGHEKGDVYLKKLSGILKNFGLRESLAARQGGDEFVLFLYQYDSEEELINTIKTLEYVQNNSTVQLEKGLTVKLGFSFGYSMVDGKTDFSALMSQADEKMYENKRMRKQMRE